MKPSVAAVAKSPPARAKKKPTAPKVEVVAAKAKPPAKKDKPKESRPAKIKLVRDSFKFPESDFALIAALKARAIKAGHAAKKSEILRAGLHALDQLSPQALCAALLALPTIKTGRPPKVDSTSAH